MNIVLVTNRRCVDLIQSLMKCQDLFSLRPLNRTTDEILKIHVPRQDNTVLPDAADIGVENAACDTIDRKHSSLVVKNSNAFVHTV